MGQYYGIANLDKREKIQTNAKHWEALNNIHEMPNYLFVLLSDLKNEELGGGDIYHFIKDDTKDNIFGRWSMDRIKVFGDYNKHYDVYSEFTDITKEVEIFFRDNNKVIFS